MKNKSSNLRNVFISSGLIFSLALVSYAKPPADKGRGTLKKDDPEIVEELPPEIEVIIDLVNGTEDENTQASTEDSKTTGKDKEKSTGKEKDTETETSDNDIIGDATPSASTKRVGSIWATTPDYYHLSQFSPSEDLYIVGPVTMVVDGDFDLGNNNIYIASTGQLTLYVGGNINIGGKGGLNRGGTPDRLNVYGTHPEPDHLVGATSTFTITGNSFVSGIIYIPNAAFESKGGGNQGATLGNIVSYTAAFKGSPGPFYFDIATKENDFPFASYKIRSYQLLKNGQAPSSANVTSMLGTTDVTTVFDSL